MRMSVMATLAALAAGAAHAESAPKAAAAEKPRLVCYSDPATGSHIKKRTCVTEQEYEARKKRDQEVMGNMKREAARQAPPPSSVR